MKELWRPIFVVAFLPSGILLTLYVLMDAASAGRLEERIDNFRYLPLLLNSG